MSGGANLQRFMLMAAIVGVLGLVAVIAMAFVNPSFALQGWLAAAFAWSSAPIGALGLLLLHALVGGSWGRAVKPALSASAWTLPLIALTFMPIIIAPSLIFPWAGAGAESDPVIAAKAAYLNPTFFALRTIAYFAIWIVLTALISANTDESRRSDRGLLIPGIGLIVFAVTVSFAAIDWAMAVDPHYSSSAFGLLITTADLLAALSFAVPLVAWFAPPAMLAAAENRRVRNALAGLLASGVLLWAYLSFMQYLVVWSGDIPQESAWYLDRTAGAWSLVARALVILLGGVPVVALALPAGRRTLQRIASISMLIFVMRLIEALWLVLPSFTYRSWLQPAAWMAAAVGLGGLWIMSVLWFWVRRPRTALAWEIAHD